MAFSQEKKIGEKNVPPHPNHLLKIQWEIHFLERHFLGLKTSQKFSSNRPTGPIRSSSRDVRLSVCLSVLNFFPECFVPKNAVPKNGFPIVFSKSDLGGGGTYFVTNIFSEKAKHTEYAQVLVVTCPKPNSVAALLSPPPTN